MKNIQKKFVKSYKYIFWGMLLVMLWGRVSFDAYATEYIPLDNNPLALVYLVDNYSVKSTPASDGEIVAEIPSGHTVRIEDAFIAEEGGYWCKVCFSVNDIFYEGYMERTYLATSDETFLEWEKQNIPAGEDEVLQAGITTKDIDTFPESYRPALAALKAEHPNWVFVKMSTGLIFDSVIKNEIGERSLVQSSNPETWKNGDYGSGWSYASEGILKYYIDPRNFLTEQHIFQFEQLTYNATYHSQEAVQKILDSTFMKGKLSDSDKLYSQAFYEIGSRLKVSPFHLACRVYQEQGKGKSPLISGTYAGYEGLYNYFNIGAVGNTDYKIITSGLTKARKEGWTTRYASLEGGAKVISQNYILKGQDTLYLQKFDVDGSYHNYYWHQYMQNIMAPASEAVGIRKAYMSTGALENPFVFKIPVYINMPEKACEMPSDKESDWPFEDVKVKADDWKYESVKYVYENGIMTGTAEDTFDPDASLTRAMFAVILYRLAGEPQVTYTNVFSDVGPGKWYSDAVIWAYNQGIVTGLKDGSYGIKDSITREQIAKMLMEYGIMQGYDVSHRADFSTFADAGVVSKWAIDYMKWSVGSGIISGVRSNDKYYLNPRDNATRAECATMLKRAIDLWEDKDETKTN